ncbi:MAG: TIGR03668 family PPOX class F420-dependent oxidoreductase [Gammaproteobacteria bacterium]
MTALPAETLSRLLDVVAVARLAVIGDGGVPEVMPIVFAQADGCLYSPVDGKPKSSARLARLAHIERQPHVGLVLDHYADDWSALWWVRLRARARVCGREHPSFAQIEAALRSKYPQYAEVPLFRDEPTLIALTITDTRWWASGGIAALDRWLAQCT